MSAREQYEQVLRDGSDIHHHLPFLMDAARGNVMEIGVRQGASTSALLAGVEAHGGHVWSIDKEECIVFPHHPDWTFIQSDSLTGYRSIKALIPDYIDLLLIDGDHTFEAVLLDLVHFGPRSKVVALHDAESEPGVMKAVRAYCTFLALDYELRHHSHGMAVITR